MKYAFLILGLLIIALPCRADDYQAGYNAGYNASAPSDSGSTSWYNQGYQAGFNDQEDEEDADFQAIEREGREADAKRAAEQKAWDADFQNTMDLVQKSNMMQYQSSTSAQGEAAATPIIKDAANKWQNNQVGAGIAAATRGDYPTAIKILRPLAEAGNTDAQYNLGAMYDCSNCLGMPTDHDQAISLFHKSAEAGNATAQFKLGDIYGSGRGVPQNCTEAAKWYRRLVEQGVLSGAVQGAIQYDLARMYYCGGGALKDTTPNYPEAMKWFQNAAASGNAQAFSMIGLMYEKGNGVEQNYIEAVKWYRKAAERGDANSQESLGDIYESGKWVPKDYVQASCGIAWSRHQTTQ